MIALCAGSLSLCYAFTLPSSQEGCIADHQPNLIPPISSTARALEYRDTLIKISPEVEWLMTLYLGPDITPDEIRKAAKAGIKGESRQR